MSAKASTEGPTLDLLIIAYGSSENDPNNDSRFTGENQRRVEVQLAPRIPAELAGNMRRMQSWARDKVHATVLDIKHSQRWHCEFCDKLARESQTDIASWLHLTPPKMVVYVHLVCNTVKGPCAARAKMLSQQMAAMNGGPPPRSGDAAREMMGDVVFPAAASCTKCEAEESIPLNLSRCARCKLARYCSVACQKEDWARHKVTCKAVQDVKWVWK
ncbi:hypothetical protein PHLGIDRAFT_190168 [Phlebiopsis gigantea 11061_1 CR5-6]|uniref:MYND-type domain-containing protein n=1 Tax=Phlebiopsis gigantea (strain 11061_1 CR5-6) TaxID=745531 RepID=A0A0C3NI43_PHLG1|nr:hypothetical protein PHLGIDRAFT_190168 [Phlebiopsis gigantea 11061_1 CR5-6]